MTRRKRSRLRRWAKREARRLRDLYARVGMRIEFTRESLIRALQGHGVNGGIARFPIELPARERRARTAKLRVLSRGIGSEYDR